MEKTLNRIRDARKRQGISLRTVARKLGLPIAELRRQEQPSSDLKLSEIQRWQQALEVPIGELLAEPHDQLSTPVLRRARIVKLMKTAASIRDRSHGTQAGNLATMLVGQLAELMPDAHDVTPWPESGPRRTLEEYGRTALHPAPDTLFPN